MQFRVGQKVESTFKHTRGEIGVVVGVTQYSCHVRGFSMGTKISDNVYCYDFEYLKPLKTINLKLI